MDSTPSSGLEGVLGPRNVKFTCPGSSWAQANRVPVAGLFGAGCKEARGTGCALGSQGLILSDREESAGPTGRTGPEIAAQALGNRAASYWSTR